MLIFFFFIISFALSYYFRDIVYSFILTPLVQAASMQEKRMIYTGLTEAFFAYIKLSAFSALILTIPIISAQIYLFIKPGLLREERRIALLILLFSPILFYIGSFFVYYLIMPNAWSFFLSYENNQEIPLILEARISEYLDLVIQFMLAFGLSFQMPIAIILLGITGIVESTSLKQKRRLIIIIIFTIAAIFTPPDVLSQVSLAIPLVLLYEISIIFCRLVERKRSKNVRH